MGKQLRGVSQKFLPPGLLCALGARCLQHPLMHGLSAKVCTLCLNAPSTARSSCDAHQLWGTQRSCPGNGRGVISMEKIHLWLSYHKSMNFKMQNTGRAHSIPLSLGNTELLQVPWTRCSYRREATLSVMFSKSTQRKNHSPWPISSVLLSKHKAPWVGCSLTPLSFSSLWVFVESKILAMVLNHTEILVHKKSRPKSEMESISNSWKLNTNFFIFKEAL